MGGSGVQQTRDIGVWMALGAARSDILRLVIAAVGLVLAMVMARGLSALLFEVSRRIPATFAGIAEFAIRARRIPRCGLESENADLILPPDG